SWLHACEIRDGHDMTRHRYEAHMEREHVTCRKEILLGSRNGISISCRLRATLFASPNKHVHAKGLAVAGHGLADTTVSVDAKRLAAERMENPGLPDPCLQCGDLLRDLAHRGEDQTERQLGRRVGGGARMLAR